MSVIIRYIKTDLDIQVIYYGGKYLLFLGLYFVMSKLITQNFDGVSDDPTTCDRSVNNYMLVNRLAVMYLR